MVIHYQNIVLRPFNNLDATNFTEAVLESVESLEPWMPWCRHNYSKHDALNWFEFTLNGLNEKTAYEFGIFSNDLQEFLGGIGLNHLNYQHKICNLGYWVRKSKQKNGVATSAVKALSQYAFQTLGFHRIEIAIALGNHASHRVAHKAGAQFECVAKNRLFLYDKPVDASLFSLVFP